MNNLLKAAVITLFLTGAAKAAQAQTPQSKTYVLSESIQNSDYSLSPFNLVQLAYRGSLTQQGIPSYQAFDTGYLSGKITAERLIQSGVSAQLVSPKALQDQSYLSAVESQLIRYRSRVF